MWSDTVTKSRKETEGNVSVEYRTKKYLFGGTYNIDVEKEHVKDVV